MGLPKKSKLSQTKIHYIELDYKSPLQEYLEALARGVIRKLRDVRIPR